MLTRLKVKGFKNLRDVDVSFGPFTCIAGPNGVGKSNLFDAISFLSDLTRYPIMEAASRVRDPLARSGDVAALLTRSASGQAATLQFEAEFIVPSIVTDDFGREARPTITFLRYVVALTLRRGGASGPDRLVLSHEELTHINLRDAGDHLRFRHDKRSFRASVVTGRRSGDPFVSTRVDADTHVVELHSDGRAGRTDYVPAETSPRTIVGATNSDSHPTVLAARREMQSWRLMQLEPGALRQPDEFGAESTVGTDGAHLPATLLRLGPSTWVDVACRLSALLPDVRELSVSADELRRVSSVYIQGADGIAYPARSLSDGTVRFLALATIGADPDACGLICLEEPENGIHPRRIPAMVDLLQSIAVDPEEAVGESNPLRQVIVNTHSPRTVAEVPEDSLLVAVPYCIPDAQGGGTLVTFEALAGTWRTVGERGASSLPLGEVLSYLDDGRSAARPRSHGRGVERTVREVAERAMQPLPDEAA